MLEMTTPHRLCQAVDLPLDDYTKPQMHMEQQAYGAENECVCTETCYDACIGVQSTATCLERTSQLKIAKQPLAMILELHCFHHHFRSPEHNKMQL